MSLPRKHVEGGYCLHNSDEGIENSFCALEAGQCNLEEQHWRSSEDAFSAESFSVCVSGDAVESVYLGKCGDGCVADAESCGGGEFEQNSLDCAVKSTTFGNCDGRCAWSKGSCEAEESYHIPGVQDDTNECTCDKVQVGGCKSPDFPIYCAVSRESCNDLQTYLTPKEVEEQEKISCFLCREEEASSSPSSFPTGSPVSSPVAQLTDSPDEGQNRKFVTWSAIGGGVIFILLMVFSGYRKRYKVTDDDDNVYYTTTPPLILDPTSFHPDDAVSILEDPSMVVPLEDPSTVVPSEDPPEDVSEQFVEDISAVS